MNDKLENLMYQAGLTAQGCWDNMDEYDHAAIQKFAELIIQECIQQAHAVSNLRGINDDMIYGADTAALRISKHFGIKS